MHFATRSFIYQCMIIIAAKHLPNLRLHAAIHSLPRSETQWISRKLLSICMVTAYSCTTHVLLISIFIYTNRILSQTLLPSHIVAVRLPHCFFLDCLYTSNPTLSMLKIRSTELLINPAQSQIHPATQHL